MDAAAIRYANAKDARKREESALATVQAELLDALEAQKISQIVSQAMQEKAHKKISRIVTRCLRAVFGDTYVFKIVFEQKRGKTEARLAFFKGEKEYDPLLDNGGGILDVAAFALRLSAMLLKKPRVEKILILDEPFRFVSAGFEANVAKMLTDISNELNIQIIMVTHKEELKIGNVHVI